MVRSRDDSHIAASGRIYPCGLSGAISPKVRGGVKPAARKGQGRVRQRGIPRHVESFIAAHLTSVAQLEILLLMHRSRGRPFTPAAVADELRIDPGWATAELERLRRASVVDTSAGEGEYCFAPKAPEVSATVDDLERLYRTHRVSVITAIFADHADSVSSFADAFKLRKDQDG